MEHSSICFKKEKEQQILKKEKQSHTVHKQTYSSLMFPLSKKQLVWIEIYKNKQGADELTDSILLFTCISHDLKHSEPNLMFHTLGSVKQVKENLLAFSNWRVCG